MKIWMSPQTEKHNPSLWRLGAQVIAIVVLAFFLIIAGMKLVYRWNLPQPTSLLVLCLFITALVIFLAYRLGRHNARNLAAFFLDEENRLFAMDFRWVLSCNHRITYHDWKRLQQWTERIRIQKIVPDGAAEILRVENIRENPSDYAVVCQVRRYGRIGRLTLMLMKGYEDEDWLLRELERRRNWDSRLAEDDDRRPLGLAVGALVLGIGALGALFSHPALGYLPQIIYFPALAVVLVGIVMLVSFIVKRHRGE
ncbi:hypothetical protein [uncultured Ruthenibacterium sp.]|uniref:hypothetical protein n=1 Tax=uncultured Ruthenibacterium sp. TaxID=1905347 RepID=UPI00349EFACA